MRKSEILNLKWIDIDFKRNLLYLIETKNGERRYVPINDTVKRTLIKVLKRPESPYVFCNESGKPYANVRTSFDTALKRAGIKDFRFHDLRHTFASHLIMLGIDLRTVQVLMGHKTIEMTLRYSHLSPDHKSRAVEILSRSFSKVDTIWTPMAEKEKAVRELSFVTIDN